MSTRVIPLGRGARTILALLSVSTANVGCAQRPYLHWQGGDVFGITEVDESGPRRVECRGTTQERFDCVAARLRKRSESRSGAFAVVTADGTLLQTTTTEPGQRIPTGPETLFPLASVTKMFTAAAAVSLAQEGSIDLHRPIADYIAEIGADTELGRVTVHQLLMHTAGLVDDPRRPLCDGDGDSDLSSAVVRAHLGVAPGTLHQYSNVGYSLVGVVIERVTSKRFEAVMRQRVLLPMGMTSATFDSASLTVRGHPAGPGTASRCRLVYPAGGLIASARDVARWARAMSEPNTHPLGPKLVETLTASSVRTGSSTDETYGYGVMTLTRVGTRVHYHGGGVENFSAFVAWVPERRFGAAAMLNTFGGGPSIAVLRGLGVLLNLPDDWRAASAERSHRPLSDYVGTYVDRKSWLGRVRVRLEGDDELAVDYLDGTPSLLPASFAFHFVGGDGHARFLATAVGIGERVPAE